MVPRISDMLFQHHRAELSRRTGTGGGAAEQLKEELREKVMGGRLLWAISASAPPSAATTAFVEDCLHVRLLDGYGSTEGGIVALNGRVLRPPVTDHKLADVPELGYFGTDSPYPRGELLIKSDRLVPGYFRRPDATTGVFDEDGFYRTGDIMARFCPD
ncbi:MULTISPECIES: AMP-binding protein [unclassified Streptomyces]|uniref:AMP-binding protein n=1 Tax=unclassified Streptomyces TaxID=2593676 RepID=UPI0037F910B4